jgi:hypothetical protein
MLVSNVEMGSDLGAQITGLGKRADSIGFSV